MRVHVNRLKKANKPEVERERSRNEHVLDRDTVDTGSRKEKKQQQEKMKN
jgi:hypothetical protein